MAVPERMAILGGGAIGASLAAVFCDAGAAVTVVEPADGRRDALAGAVAAQHGAMARAGLARGSADEALARLTAAAAQAGAVEPAGLVLEAGPERQEAKQAIFAEALGRAGPGAVLATTSSAMPISAILPAPQDQARCLVAHPANPPAVLRLIELVPAPHSDPSTTARAQAAFAAAGFDCVVLGREIEGFVLNRLQGAVLREAYRLVAEGVADVAGIDAVMRQTLGPRWALSGPFETADLNVPGGIPAHAARMGPAYRAMGESRGETDAGWPEALVARVTAERRALLPAEALPARARWRAEAVAEIVALRDRLERRFRKG